jgi:dienelactone hydrolase
VQGPRLTGLAIALALAAPLAAQAKVLEERLTLPVQVTDAYGKRQEHSIQVVLFTDSNQPAPRPLLVLNHGRATEAQARAALGLARYPVASRWLAAQGFAVAVPTRVGYGESGGPDVEDTGACENKRYPPGYAAAAQQTLQVMSLLRQRPDILPERNVVMGQSYGGATAVALAAQNPAGVVAAINFAGGGGGDPKNHPQRPCSPVRLKQMFEDYGRTARVPMLWVYTENDMFFGPELPREWHAAFTAAGGQAEFKQFAPDGEDGHGLFARSPQLWQPVVADFLKRQGFAVRALPPSAPSLPVQEKP